MRKNDKSFEPVHTAPDGSMMGKRGAVRNNSGLPVDHSGPGLGRANNSTNSQPKAGGLPTRYFFSQPKSGQGSGDGVPGGGEAVRSSSLVIQRITAHVALTSHVLR